jgi:hypothetical protein
VWRFLETFLCEYWREHKSPIHYHLLDYALAIAYADNIGGFRDMVNLLPESNQPILDLSRAICSGEDPARMRQLLSAEAAFHKLSWKLPQGPSTDEALEVLREQLSAG